MKNLFAFAIVATCLLFVPSAKASVNIANLDRLSASVCEFVKSNNRSALRKKLKSSNLNLRKVYDGLVCQPEGDFSGGSLLRAASFYGSTDISKFLIRKIKKEHITAKEHDGQSVVEWSESALAAGGVKDTSKTQAILDEIKSKIAS
ncbi:DUF3718 domain-containing protein [Aliikangiella marina]|uniref:DUF3718 domain-containing protein n=1 Tax=Aliikangiella marina TaxID=1712262 RepID=A0A545TC03_9GAMM|nr:DUF3718 domain-containing protein [Aliikangiella marina]TQV74729.1 DUF3718 domain-containing protein [Aliikangiella marina]